MPNVFTIIGQSFEFYRKQPVLNSVALWLLFLPMVGIFGLQNLQEHHPLFTKTVENGFNWGSTDIRPFLLIIILNIALSLIVVWGSACILIVSKKLVVAKAGRSRSSFKQVRKEGSKYILTLFLTSILRDCFSLLWSLLLIIPGIIYSIRTFFYQMAIVYDGLEYRSALKKSKEVITGQTWTAFLFILGLSVVLFLPVTILIGVLDAIVLHFDTRLLIATNIINAGIFSITILIYIISSAILYAELLASSKK